MTGSLESLLEAARTAHRDARLNDARDAYRRVATLGETEGKPAVQAHALRHLSDLARTMGDTEQALTAADDAAALYRENGGELELANALRLRALALDALGRDETARSSWAEACELYRRVRVEAGVSECERRLQREP